MLRQRLDAVQWLVPAGSFPVCLDLILAKLGPLSNELQCAGLKMPGENFAIDRYRSAPSRVIGMKVRYRVILLIPVHVDHDPVERADTRHVLTVSDPIFAAQDLDGTTCERAALALFHLRTRYPKPAYAMNLRTSRGEIYCYLVLDLSGLDLEEIGNALADQTDHEHRWLISPQTGEVVFWTADTGIDGQTPVDLDELDLVRIDPLPSWVWYQDMADFAEAITDERAGRRLARAIQGKGAFRRFKDQLHDEYPDLLPTWYAFRGIRTERRAVQWLADNSLIDDDAASRFLAGHPDPDLP